MINIRRTFDPTIHNRIANIPSVRKDIGGHLGPEGEVDFSDIAGKPSEWILLNNGHDAAFVGNIISPVVIDLHYLFAPSCRGRRAIDTGKAMVRWIFENTSTLMVIGSQSVNLKSARWFSRQIGGISDGIRLVDNQNWRQEVEHFHALKAEWLCSVDNIPPLRSGMGGLRNVGSATKNVWSGPCPRTRPTT